MAEIACAIVQLFASSHKLHTFLIVLLMICSLASPGVIVCAVAVRASAAISALLTSRYCLLPHTNPDRTEPARPLTRPSSLVHVHTRSIMSASTSSPAPASATSTAASPAPSSPPSLALCQREGGAFLRRCTARVLSCIPTPIDKAASSKKSASKKKGGAVANGSGLDSASTGSTFDVVLSDTVLFPEGGGQPSDTGSIRIISDNDANAQPLRVLHVSRTPTGTVHRVSGSVDVGIEVEVLVDWDRRLDHMQHHTGQHLLSALLRKHAGLKTTSWWLATWPAECHIELDGVLSAESMKVVEDEANELIRQATQVKLHIYPSIAEAHQDAFFVKHMQKAIPSDVVGAVRVIQIGEIMETEDEAAADHEQSSPSSSSSTALDFNPCCGTHLTGLSQLQLVKLTRIEVSKDRKSCKAFFLAGSRLHHTLTQALDVQRELTSVLSCGTEGFVSNVTRIQAELKSMSKQLQMAREEIARNIAMTLIKELQLQWMEQQNTGNIPIVAFHREEANLPFLSNLADAIFDEAKNLSSPSSSSPSSAPSLSPSFPVLAFLSGSDAPSSATGACLLIGGAAGIDNDHVKELESRAADCVTRLAPILAAGIGAKGGGRKGRWQGKTTQCTEETRAKTLDELRKNIASSAASTIQ